MAASATPPEWKWVTENVLKKIKVNGYRQLGYHIRSIQGDRDAFDVQNYSGLGGKTFTDIGQLQFSGRKVLGVLNFDATLQDSRFTDPMGQRFLIDYERGGWKVNFGDVNASLLNTNRYASFNRNIRGFQVGYKSGRFEGRALSSQAKASVKTVSLVGNGSSGPYYLQVTQIVPDTERVQVDGETLQRGTDYVVSYEVGSITFVNRTISPSSSIVVTFEALGFNTRQGFIEGVGTSYDMGKVGRLGITAMRQKARGNPGIGSTRLEKFFGFGPPSAPYSLQFEPESTRPITIRVNGVLQSLGTDYTFDSELPSTFYFTRFMAPTDEIDVVYTPKARATVDGDREVLGFDYRIPLGNGGSISYGQAFGKLKNPLNPSSGLARNLTATTRVGEYLINASLRYVPAGYVSIETRSFNRNERAGDFSISRNGNGIRYGVSTSNSSVTSRQVASTGAVTYSRARVTNTSGFLSLTPTGDQPWFLTVDRKRNKTLGNPSEVDTIGLSTNKQFNNWSYRIGTNYQSGKGPTSFSSGSEIVKFNVLGLIAGVRWNPNTRLAIDGSTSISAVRSGDKDGTGRRQDFSATYIASNRLSWVARYSDTDSGGVSDLGAFSNGSGFGYNGSGFSGGVTTPTFVGSSGSRLASFGAEYKANDKLSLSFDAFLTRYIGSATSNSQTRGFGLSAVWDFSDQNRFTLRADTSSTKFIGSPSRSSATTLFATLDGTLGSRLNYSLRGSTILTGGTSAFKQNGVSFEGSARYFLAPRQNLLFDVIYGGTSGYLPQSDLGANLTYQYQLYESLALNLGYRWRDVRNRDSSSSGAYRANSLDLTLSFSFTQ